METKQATNTMTQAERLEACASTLRRHGFDARIRRNSRTGREGGVRADARRRGGRDAATGVVRRLDDDARHGNHRMAAQRPALDAARRIRRLDAPARAARNTPQGPPVGPLHHGNQRRNDREEAEERIRRIAAPQNIARHEGFRTPCAKTGVCMDCNSPDRICNTRMEMLRCHPKGRIHIVLIDKELGL